jgi:hypothetical protein
MCLCKCLVVCRSRCGGGGIASRISIRPLALRGPVRHSSFVCPRTGHLMVLRSPTCCTAAYSPCRVCSLPPELVETKVKLEETLSVLDSTKSQLREKNALVQEVLQVRAGALVVVACCWVSRGKVACVLVACVMLAQREADRLAEEEVKAAAMAGDTPRSDDEKDAEQERRNAMMTTCVWDPPPFFARTRTRKVPRNHASLAHPSHPPHRTLLHAFCFCQALRRDVACGVVCSTFAMTSPRSFKVQRNERGPPETILCARCHAIIAELNETPEDPEAPDGESLSQPWLAQSTGAEGLFVPTLCGVACLPPRRPGCRLCFLNLNLNGL